MDQPGTLPDAKHVMKCGGDLEADFRIGEALGFGLNGAVRLATCRNTGREFALKSFDKRALTGSRLSDMYREAQIHSALDHPNLVRLERIYESGDYMHLVLERLSGGEVTKRLRPGVCFSESAGADIARQVLIAIAYLHSVGIVHHDIKPENVVFVREGDDRIKLIDFGFAVRWDGEMGISLRCGTVGFVAPEILRPGELHTEKADMFSFGALLYAMLTAKKLYGGPSSVMLERAKAGKIEYSEEFSRLSPGVQSLIRSLLSTEPSLRPSARQALEHPWFLDAVLATVPRPIPPREVARAAPAPPGAKGHQNQEKRGVALAQASPPWAAERAVALAARVPAEGTDALLLHAAGTRGPQNQAGCTLPSPVALQATEKPSATLRPNLSHSCGAADSQTTLHTPPWAAERAATLATAAHSESKHAPPVEAACAKDLQLQVEAGVDKSSCAAATQRNEMVGPTPSKRRKSRHHRPSLRPENRGAVQPAAGSVVGLRVAEAMNVVARNLTPPGIASQDLGAALGSCGVTRQTELRERVVTPEKVRRSLGRRFAKTPGRTPGRLSLRRNSGATPGIKRRSLRPLGPKRPLDAAGNVVNTATGSDDMPDCQCSLCRLGGGYAALKSAVASSLRRRSIFGALWRRDAGEEAHGR